MGEAELAVWPEAKDEEKTVPKEVILNFLEKVLGSESYRRKAVEKGKFTVFLRLDLTGV